MWIESNTPELAVPYLWSEEKQSSECIDLSYFTNDASTKHINDFKI